VVTIVESAILFQGRMFTGRRHHDVIHKIVLELEVPRVVGKQGFVTSEGVFVDREQAAKIALASGQVKKLQFHSRELFSEDLY
jgi:hypothetical protein